MEFRIADSFQSSLNKLTNNERKIVKTKAFDMQMNLGGNSNQFHKIEKVKDPNFWSARVNRDIRIIVHKTGNSLMLAYVDHHDAAYLWAQKRKIEDHPITGAAQIVELKYSESIDFYPAKESIDKFHEPQEKLFKTLDPSILQSFGVPIDWIEDVLNCSEDTFFDILEHLPSEAAEALLEIAGGDQSV